MHEDRFPPLAREPLYVESRTAAFSSNDYLRAFLWVNLFPFGLFSDTQTARVIDGNYRRVPPRLAGIGTTKSTVQ